VVSLAGYCCLNCDRLQVWLLHRLFALTTIFWRRHERVFRNNI
jgi:hypothetical protein